MERFVEENNDDNWPHVSFYFYFCHFFLYLMM